LLAIVALLVSTAAIYMALIKPFPVQWLYYHYFLRKPIVWSIFGASLLWVAWLTADSGTVPTSALTPLALMALAIVMAYRMHQETAFPAVDFPAMAEDPLSLPLKDDAQLAVIEQAGVTKAYPLDYLIHHHIINDRFGNRTIALTYCAMCRSVIPFDVTDIGPLFVGSFKDANMIVADRRTKTFFQQATFNSIIGRLHPRALEMIPFQILPWAEVKRVEAVPRVCRVEQHDLREFELPIPGVWRKIVAGEVTPGLPSKLRDKSFPARTRVVGVIDPIAKPQVVYLKRELMEQGVVRIQALNAFLVAMGDCVNGFKGIVAGKPIELILNKADGILCDAVSGTVWDVRGKFKGGGISSDLQMLALSDEYWFSWRAFHPGSQVVRVQ
jgi:hypothetical protein